MKKAPPPAAKPPIPAAHHRTKIKHKSADGKYKAPPDGTGGFGEQPGSTLNANDVDRPITQCQPDNNTGDEGPWN